MKNREDIKMNNKETGEAGFTLIELMVSVAILGIALMPLMSAYTTSWQASVQSDLIAQAQMFGRWKADQIMVEEGYALASNSSGNFGTDWGLSRYDNFNYEVSVETISDASTNFSGKKVKISIIYMDFISGQERTIQCNIATDCDRPDFVFVLAEKTPA